MSRNGEIKKARKIIFTKGGNGSTSCRVSLPKSWIDEMNISKEDNVKISFIDNKIIIEKN